MNRSQVTWLAVFPLSALLAGCEGPSGPDRVLEPGIIVGAFEDDPQVALTTEGDSLTVEVTTYGDGCQSKGETRVTVDVDTRSATVAPFDWSATGGTCTAILNSFDHAVTLDLEGGGEWTIVVAGRDMQGQSVQFQFPVLSH